MGTVKAYALRAGKLSKVSLQKAVKLRGLPGTALWVDIEDPSKSELHLLEKGFKFHHLAVEDAGNERQRSKVEEYDSFMFIVLRVFQKGECEATQLNLFVDGNLLVTTHFKCIEGIEEVARELERNPAMLSRGPDFLAYQIIDLAVDSIFPHLEEIEDTLEDFETVMLKATSPDEIAGTLGRFFEIKKKNLAIRKIAWPMRDVLTVLARRDYKYVRPENTVYFRDVYDHMLRITDMTEMNREVLSASMEAYLAVISNNLNVVMKKLAAIGGIFAAPLLVAGIYGMNTKMPIFDMDYGYLIALGEMLLIATLMFLYFRMCKWL